MEGNSGTFALGRLASHLHLDAAVHRLPRVVHTRLAVAERDAQFGSHLMSDFVKNILQIALAQWVHRFYTAASDRAIITFVHFVSSLAERQMASVGQSVEIADD